MKRTKETMKDPELMKTLDLLYTTTASIRGRQAVKQFLKDLLTPSERIMLGRRIWIARLLIQGTSYEEIAIQLRVGMSTIRRVRRWLEDAIPGYEHAIAELEKEMDTRALKREARENPFSFAAMKRKYPLYYLLFPNPKPKKKYRD